MGDDVISRVEALVADWRAFGDGTMVKVRLGDLRQFLALALKLEALDRLSPNLEGTKP